MEARRISTASATYIATALSRHNRIIPKRPQPDFPPRILACSQKVQRHVRRISHHPTIMAPNARLHWLMITADSSVFVPDLSKVSLRNPNVRSLLCRPTLDGSYSSPES